MLGYRICNGRRRWRSVGTSNFPFNWKTKYAIQTRNYFYLDIFDILIRLNCFCCIYTYLVYYRWLSQMPLLRETFCFPAFITGLLNNVGTHIDPTRLIKVNNFHKYHNESLTLQEHYYMPVYVREKGQWVFVQKHIENPRYWWNTSSPWLYSQITTRLPSTGMS